MEPEIRHIAKTDFAKHRVVRSDGEVTIDGVYPTREDGYYMVRSRIPGGLVTIEQAEALARFADTYANGVWHIDTRANVEFHGVAESAVVPFVEEIEKTGLTTRGACGDSVRNIVVGSESNLRNGQKLQALVEGLTQQFAGIPQFETLPRKFKMAFYGADDREPLHRVNDLGFLEAGTKDGELLFDVWIGGKLGREARLGDLLARGVPERDVAGLVLAAVHLHDKLSNRKNRARARFSFVLTELGVDEIRTSLLKVWKPTDGGVDLEPRESAKAAPGRLSASGVHSLSDGRFRVRVPVVAGDLTSQEVERITSIAREINAESIQLSVRQNLSLVGVRAADVPLAVSALEELGYPPSGWSGARDVVACPGATNCRKGFVETHGLARAISDTVSNADVPDWAKRFRISASGCPNSCSHPQLYDLGFKGNAGKANGHIVKGFDFLLGGRLYGRTLLGQQVASLLSAEDVTATTTAFAALWNEYGYEDEAFDAFVDRVGLEFVATKLQERVTLEQGEWQTGIPAFDLNAYENELEELHPRDVLRWAVQEFGEDLLVTSALGAGGLLQAQWLREIAPEHPVYFVDTGKHFPETLDYLRELQAFGLDIRTARAGFEEDEFADIYGDELWERDPDLCCQVRKVQVVEQLRKGKRAWVSGIRREQGGSRSEVAAFQSDGTAFKISPLAGWTRKQIDEELRTYGIPPHPLTRQGYSSVGCGPCTQPSLGSERNGRWAGKEKSECGLHLSGSGRFISSAGAEQ
ncbi:MAG: phosphoadenylyl-sulfate reductase [Planctomycetota bacterium]|jgi:phosphoadenylyl-sulfate reductase (thioredoxin)